MSNSLFVMTTRPINHWIPLASALLMCAAVSRAQTSSNQWITWQNTQDWAARGLFNKRDFSPINEAFASKDIMTLWDYYKLSTSYQYGHPRDDTPNEIDSVRYTNDEVIALNHQIRERAGTSLKEIPGHARLIGDIIDAAADMAKMEHRRDGWFQGLARLGSDECIEQLGRFLFDERCPDYFNGPDMGMSVPPNNVEATARAKLCRVLRDRKMLPEGMVDADGKWNYKKMEEITDWWLKSAAAAPYRRMLADAGVVLPPGYPPMEELKGAKTTIAPTLILPPKKRFELDPEGFMAEYRLNQKKWSDAYNRADYDALIVRKSAPTNSSAVNKQTLDPLAAYHDGKPAPNEPSKVRWSSWPVLAFIASLIILAGVLALRQRKRR